MRRAVTALMITAVTLAALGGMWSDAVPWLRGPTNKPEWREWRWSRKYYLPSDGGNPEDWCSSPQFQRARERLGPAVASAAALGAILLLTALPAARRRARGASRYVLWATTVLGLCISIGLMDAEGPGASAELVRRTMDPVLSSYHSVANEPRGNNALYYLQHYGELLDSFVGNNMHAATHPPGPVLFHRAVSALCESSPRLTNVLLCFVDRANLRGANRTGYAIPDNAPPAQLASALLASVLLMLAAAAPCWPAARLARALGSDRLAAARIGALVVFVPGPVLMAPTIDQAMALPVMATVAWLLVALRQPSLRACLVGLQPVPDGSPLALRLRRCGRRALGGTTTLARAAAAGVFAGLSLFISYGAAIFLLIGGVSAAAASTARRGWWLRLPFVTLVSVGVAAALFGVPWLVGAHPVDAAYKAVGLLQGVFYINRTYYMWLFFGPLDVVIFAGIPVAALLLLRAAAGLPSFWRRRVRRRSAAADRFRVMLLLGLAGGTVSGLWRGENGRLCASIMPVMLVAALARPPLPRRAPAASLSEAPEVSDSSAGLAHRRWTRMWRRVHRAPGAFTSLGMAGLLFATCAVIRICWFVP